MSTNPHLDNAEDRLAGVHEWQEEEGSTDATNIAAAIDGLAEAVLALAWEQGRCADEARTANMLALLVAGYATVQVARVDYETLATQIVARLYPKDSK
jgi:hypothetical protein